ncbi:TM0106 family RecB-like putative nuclease [Mycolicibacterium helvum]|nr:TM0106 family RecB-like putative nuclease [Mycolicibacterium helvum]
MTPSKVTAWLECPHYLTLRGQVDGGLIDDPKPVFGSFARLVADKGIAHERDCLENYRRQGKSILEVPQRQEGERFSDWVERIGNPLAGVYDVFYQMPFIHDGIQGIADFVIRGHDSETGTVSYEPVDAKLTRVEAKPGHVLQLCFYAEALRALTHTPVNRMHLWLGSGHLESLRVNEFRSYWRRLRTQLSEAIVRGPDAATVPQPCLHCDYCEFDSVCEERWRSEDSLVYVAGIRQRDITTLTGADLPTLTQLAGATDPVEGMNPTRLTRLVGQAALQLQARVDLAGPPPFSIIAPSNEPVWGRGLEQLPAPDDGDVFLDFEGHPFWRPDTGLFFLFGLLERNGCSDWTYRAWWAHDQGQEADAVGELVVYLRERRNLYPGMHVYHYNHTERSALRGLAESYGVTEAELTELVDTGAFVDLYAVALNSFQVGAESYGLKSLERLAKFQRSHDIDKGAGAVVQYEQYMVDGDEATLAPIAAYNEDDVRATRALRHWLLDNRPAGLAFRDAVTEPEQGIPELNERVVRLHEFGEGTREFFLGDLLGYWWREWKAYIVPRTLKLQADPDDLLTDPEALACMEFVTRIERIGKRGRPISPLMRFSFPAQNLERFPRGGGTVIFLDLDGKRLYSTIERLDRASGEVDLIWGEKLRESGCVPASVVLDDWVDPKSKALALQAFADDILAGRPPNPVTVGLIDRQLPRFTAGGPADGVFIDDLVDMTRWVTQLDHSFVAIQGPPGAGKTHNAAHLIYTLITAGMRVGITATSHVAITHLLQKVIAVFTRNGRLIDLRAAHKGPEGVPSPIGATSATTNAACAGSNFNLVAGTTWLFASNAMAAEPVDVLVVDEAGQMSLADTLAASRAAHNLIVLGDPLQLPQVAQAVHPRGSGRSVLEHIVGENVTLADDRGVFLTETWRMHPDVCGFISEQIYEGRLTHHPDCERQSTSAGTGLRWLQAAHDGNGTSSTEEADVIVDQIRQLIGTEWTDFDGCTKPLITTDFMVVTPYNDQVRAIRDGLARHAVTAGVPVGTVDKFQGKEAAVVFFSMATSSGEDIVRGIDFLFSRNRLNVAVSRARCLAYLVCTEELLNTRARTVNDMRLLATLNSFVEDASRYRR